MNIRKFRFDKYLIGSIVFAFGISILTVSYVYPSFFWILYTSINNPNFQQFSVTFFIKVFSVLLTQTSVLGFIFYSIAKKLF